VFNDRELTDHHALIPLTPLPQGVSEDEKKVYNLVLRRFAAVFHADHEFETTEIITSVGEDDFRTRGKITLVPGWTVLYQESKQKKKADSQQDEEDQENLIPLEKGDQGKVSKSDLVQKQTQPPPEYTEALLLKDMTNPERYASEDFRSLFRGDIGLGTQATRAQIIETLLARKYVERKGKKLIPLEKGCTLIEQIRKLGTTAKLASPDETGRWEMNLEKITQGTEHSSGFLEDIKEFTVSGIQELKTADLHHRGPEIGKCPACGGKIIEGKKGYGCSNWKEELGGCRFVIWKNISGKTLCLDNVKELLGKGITQTLTFQSKKGNPFHARLKLVEEEGRWKTVFDFVNQESISSQVSQQDQGLSHG
jgi:DNA topoisomerase-3